MMLSPPPPLLRIPPAASSGLPSCPCTHTSTTCLSPPVFLSCTIAYPHSYIGKLLLPHHILIYIPKKVKNLFPPYLSPSYWHKPLLLRFKSTYKVSWPVSHLSASWSLERPGCLSRFFNGGGSAPRSSTTSCRLPRLCIIIQMQSQNTGFRSRSQKLGSRRNRYWQWNEKKRGEERGGGTSLRLCKDILKNKTKNQKHRNRKTRIKEKEAETWMT